MSDEDKHPVETPREWLRYAEGELGVAEREMKAESPSLSYLNSAPTMTQL